MASEADFSDLVVMERAVEITFLSTGDRLSFARFGALLSPARPIGPANFGPHPTWEVEWLARNLAQQALLRFGKSAALATQRSEAWRTAGLVSADVVSAGVVSAGVASAAMAQTNAGQTDAGQIDAGRPAMVPTGLASQPTHVHLQHDLALAIERGELTLHYQPICVAQTRAIAGQEALLRWTHPARGLIPPAEFIPLAEGSGDIAAIGRWVLDHALAEAATWEQPWRVAVNLSPVQFRQADLVDMVRTSLARHRLPGARLELEITEGVLIDDTSRALTVLRALKRLGVTIALDDFGTGYSNLTYLRLLPLDRIKIDKSFIQDLGTSSQVDAIVLAIIGMGKALGLEVTAEGIETEAQLAFLRAHDCALVQGFLLGRPSPGPLRRRAPQAGPSAAARGPRADRAVAACC